MAELNIDTELAICERATKGPWSVWDGPQYEGGGADLCIGSGDEWLANMDHAYRRCQQTHEATHKNDECPICTIDSGEITREQRANAEFIADARTGYPEALRRLKRLAEILAKPEYQPSYKDEMLSQCEPTIDLTEWNEIQRLLVQHV